MTTGNSRIRFASILILSIVLNIALDQITKKLVRDNISFRERIELINDYVILTKVENTGAFLSLGENLNPQVKSIVLWALPSLVLGIMLYMMLFTQKIKPNSAIALSFVLGGGIGNMYDRILYGSVTDFMVIDLQFARTGVFNAADVSIMVGTGLLILAEWKNKKIKKLEIETDS